MMVTGKLITREMLFCSLIGLLAACSSTPDKPEPVAATNELPDALTATNWKVDKIYENDADAAVSTLRFAENDKVGGNAGCNNFSGQVTREGTSIDFGLLATTRKMCEPAVNGQERAYLEALDAVSSWSRIGGQLKLADEEGVTVIKLQAFKEDD